MAFALIAVAVVAAVSKVVEANQKAAQLKQQANIATMNSRMSADTARTELVAADMEERTLRRQGRSRTAEQFAAFAESGFDPTTGGAQLSMENSLQNLEMDAATARYKGQMRSRTHGVQAQQYAYEAKTYRAQAKGVKSAGYLGAATSLISSFAGGIS